MTNRLLSFYDNANLIENSASKSTSIVDYIFLAAITFYIAVSINDMGLHIQRDCWERFMEYAFQMI
jgi:hypothetical protein